MMFRRSVDDLARERAADAEALAQRAMDQITFHTAECARRWEEMKSDQQLRHFENVRRFDYQDLVLKNMTTTMWRMLISFLGAAGMVIVTLVGWVVTHGRVL